MAEQEKNTCPREDIPDRTSRFDYNGNGKTDIEDFLEGADRDAKNRLVYDGTYIAKDSGYPFIKKRDPKIDFRRVRTLKVYFRNHGESCPLELSDPEDFQLGDVVVLARMTII